MKDLEMIYINDGEMSTSGNEQTEKVLNKWKIVNFNLVGEGDSTVTFENVENHSKIIEVPFKQEQLATMILQNPNDSVIKKEFKILFGENDKPFFEEIK